jgi:hypothetical protein
MGFGKDYIDLGYGIQFFSCYGEEMSGGHGSHVQTCEKCGKKNVSTDWFIGQLCKEHLAECYDFWDKEDDRPHMDICDIDVWDFVLMHKNLLELANSDKGIFGHFTRHDVGTFIMGRYYLEGFSSRSCAGQMAGFMGVGDYLHYYCGSSSYYDLMMLGSEKWRKMLIQAAEKDEAGKAFKRLFKGTVKPHKKRVKE